ncbi:uncharacterized protein LOC122531997 [Frieseomelitta varia]|uniref:uncharacterized protein LOC122531997 n=1 Tax=Frieseomelitta varia TaxID=561572 RepID=UPI001CB6AAD4|nr:uncharacterized protein LOC122531997 [Frieseomelitta varia]
MLIDKSRNYYWTLFANVIIILFIIILFCRDNFFILTILHIHGLYRIATYQIKNAVDRNSIEMGISKKDIVIHNQIIHAMEIYSSIIKWIRYLKHNFSFSCLVTAVVGSIYYAMVMFNISRTISHGYRFVMIMNFVIIINIIILGIKILYRIQCVFDESQKFFYIPYTVEWYNLSLSIQKLLLFIMQGNHHSAVLNLYSILIPTLENLSTEDCRTIVGSNWLSQCLTSGETAAQVSNCPIPSYGLCQNYINKSILVTMWLILLTNALHCVYVHWVSRDPPPASTARHARFKWQDSKSDVIRRLSEW